MSPEETPAFDEVLEIFLDGELGNFVHIQLRDSLVAKEQEVVREEMEELIRANASLGGSESGFYLDNELFGRAAALEDEAVTEIHDSLKQQAEMLRMNRSNIAQHITYIAHFLGYLDTNVEDPATWAANMVPGLSQFSSALKVFESHYENIMGEKLKDLQFDREDPTKAIYFMHFDKVQKPLNRFIFRKITR